jgi:hypothetical protein
MGSHRKASASSTATAARARRRGLSSPRCGHALRNPSQEGSVHRTQRRVSFQQDQRADGARSPLAGRCQEEGVRTATRPVQSDGRDRGLAGCDTFRGRVGVAGVQELRLEASSGVDSERSRSPSGRQWAGHRCERWPRCTARHLSACRGCRRRRRPRRASAAARARTNQSRVARSPYRRTACCRARRPRWLLDAPASWRPGADTVQTASDARCCAASAPCLPGASASSRIG